MAPAPTASPASPHRPSWGHPAAGGAALAAAWGVWAGLRPGMPPLFKGSPSLGRCHMAAPSARPEPARPGPRCPDLVPARARSLGGCDRRLGRAAAGAVGQPQALCWGDAAGPLLSGSPTALSLRLQGCARGRVLWEGAVGGWWDPAPTRCPGAAAPRSRQPRGLRLWLMLKPTDVSAGPCLLSAAPLLGAGGCCSAFLPGAGPARPPQLKKAAGLARAEGRQRSGPLHPSRPPCTLWGCPEARLPPVPGSGQARLVEVAAAACPARPVRPASRAGTRRVARF